MANDPISYRSFPPDLRYALYCLFCGWIAIYCFAYLITTSPGTLGLLLGLGVAGCFSLIKVKEWARRLTITGDIVIVVSFLLFAAALRNSRIDLSVLALIIAVVFSLATYFLITRETSAFFKAANSNRNAAAKA
jgi:hypothetical protein